MAIELAQRRVNEFRQRCGDYGETALHLAYHAALPVALNAEFLHLLRINFFLDPPETLPYTAEFEFLLSPLCREIDEGLYEIEPEVRDVLLTGLTQTHSPQRIRDLATLLWQYVDHRSPWADRTELERAQQLTALNFLDPEKAQQWLAAVEPNANQGESTEREWFVAMQQEIENQTQLRQEAAQRRQKGLATQPQSNPFEVVLRSPDDAKEWVLRGELIRIGRGEGNDLVLHQPEVSRQHAEIFSRYLTDNLTQLTYFFRDFSRWGTWILTPDTEEWQRVHQQEVMLPTGTQLKFGNPISSVLEFSIRPIKSPEQVESGVEEAVREEVIGTILGGISTTVIKHESTLFDQEVLQDFVNIKFRIEGVFALNEQPSRLPTIIENKSSTATIIIDWDRGTLNNFWGISHRLVRLVDSMEKGSLDESQTISIISPKRSLGVSLSADNLLEFDPKTNLLSCTKPIVDVEKLEKDKDAEPRDKQDEERIQKLKNAYNNFVTKQEPLKFTLRLPLQITNIESSKQDVQGFAYCNFSVSLGRAARPQPVSKQLTPEQRRRLERDEARLQERDTSLNKHLQNLRRDYATETNAAKRLRLQKQIEAVDLELEQLQAKLEDIHQQLS